MKSVNENQVEWTAQRSPSGKFHMLRRNLSIALGAPKDASPGAGGHPFDVELVRVPPGATNCPFHEHSSQWEFYRITAGSGVYRDSTGVTQISAGDCFMAAPGEPHHLTNTGDIELEYMVIADNPISDIIRYPDSGKWFVKPQRILFRLHEVDYYDGEDPA